MVAADLRAHDLDVLVVDDGSTDHTRETAQQLGLPVISHPFNLGIGGAMQTGFQFALAQGYEVAVQFDGDHQHRADQIPTLIEPVLSGKADLVIGSRIRAGGYAFPLLRRLGGQWFSFLLGLLGGLNITDPTSGFRCYGLPAIRFFADRYPDDFPEVESTLLATRHGLRVTEVPALMRPRLGGTSSITGLRTAYYMIKVTLSLTIAMMKSV